MICEDVSSVLGRYGTEMSLLAEMTVLHYCLIIKDGIGVEQ
jgi:hypothetical protein